jgi:predicted PurR-regulated permease PerM
LPFPFNGNRKPPAEPVAAALAAAHIPSCTRLAAVLLSLSLVVAVAALVALMVLDGLSSFHEKHGAEFAQRAEASVRVLVSWIQANLHLNAASLVTSIDALQKEWWTASSLMNIANTLLAVAVTLLLLLYLLLDTRYDDPGGGGDSHSRRDDEAAPAVSPTVLVLRDMWVLIERSVHKYIVAKTLVSAVMGASVWLILGPLLHVHLAHLFGVLTFFLNFIPNIGALVAFAAPLPMIFLDPRLSPASQAMAVVLPLIVHTLIGAVIEPLLFGSLLQLHPVVVLLALGAWFVIWGIPGAVLAVPITSVLCIALKTLAVQGAGVDGDTPLQRSRYALFAVRFLEDCVLDFVVLAHNDNNDGAIYVGARASSSRASRVRGSSGDFSDGDEDAALDGSTRALLSGNRPV